MDCQVYAMLCVEQMNHRKFRHPTKEVCYQGYINTKKGDHLKKCLNPVCQNHRLIWLRDPVLKEFVEVKA